MHISVLQEHAYDQEKVAHLVQNCHTSVELLREMCNVYAERPMYGFCEPGSCQWQTITYKQAYQRVEHLAAGEWAAHLATCPNAHVVFLPDLVILIGQLSSAQSFTSPEWRPQ